MEISRLGSNNPHVIPAPNVIREYLYLGVNNLTKEQFDAHNLGERSFLIDGPAGAGKSAILIAKAMQLAKLDANRKSNCIMNPSQLRKGSKLLFKKQVYTTAHYPGMKLA